MKKTPRGVQQMEDGRYRLFAVRNHRRIRPIVTWPYLKQLGVQVPENNKQGEPGLELAKAALDTLKSQIREEKKTGAIAANAKVKIGELLVLVENDYARRGLKSWKQEKARWENHAKRFFADLWANELTSDMIDKYAAARKKEKASAATVNRELSLIRRALTLGMEGKSPKVRTKPKFNMYKEPEGRQGFLTDEGYDRLAEECSREGKWLRGMFEIGASFGWRRNEVLSMKVSQLDFSDRVIYLNAGTTKNNDGRVVVMTQAVYEALRACAEGKSGDDFVFTRETGRHRGKRVRDFRKAWKEACDRAQCQGLMYHDLRRTGARNLRRLGVAEKAIMKIGGWKTREIFERYNILDHADLEDAARRLDEKRERRALELAEKAAEQAASAQKSATEPSKCALLERQPETESVTIQ